MQVDQRDIALRHLFGLDIGGEWSVVRGMRATPKNALKSQSPESIALEVERLIGLPLEDLRAAWAALFRRDPPKRLWRDFLVRTLAWRLQEKAFGSHDKATLRLLEAYVQKRPGDKRCQRLKAGTALIREYGGVRHTVTIVPEGFVWREKTYSSLTAISRLITGVNWNGPRFFGLREGKGGNTGKGRENAA